MQQLTGLDASFLYLETPNAPMHIGGVSIVEGETANGRFEIARVRDLLASRIHTSRTFIQRLVGVPLKLGNPYWAPDESFDLDRHLFRTQLPEPGGWKELSALMAWEFSRPLDRDKPLWEVLFVEGLETVDGVPPGAVALISKIHHAAIDGVSGSEIMSALFDPSAEPRTTAPAPPASPELPSRTRLLKRSGRQLLRVPRALSGTLGETVKGVVKSGAVWGLKRIKLPPLPFTAPRSRLNVPISRERAWGAAILPLDRVKALRRLVPGATVNDVVLAVCAGALRRYLLEKDDLPAKPLVAMVPISVRGEDERGTMGNHVSAMLVSLATDVEDPAERLEKVHAGSAAAKVHHQAIGARTLSDFGQFIPFGLAGVAARLYTRMQLAERHRPIFNLVITNVPGPRVPLYVAGARLLAHVGAAPLFDGMALILPIFSYAGSLAIGATADREVMPDVDVFTRHLKAALDELEHAGSR